MLFPLTWDTKDFKKLHTNIFMGMDKRYTIWSQNEIMIMIGEESFIILDFFNIGDDKYYYEVKFDGYTSKWIQNYVEFLEEINKSWECCYSPKEFEKIFLKDKGFTQGFTTNCETNEIVKFD